MLDPLTVGYMVIAYGQAEMLLTPLLQQCHDNHE